MVARFAVALAALVFVAPPAAQSPAATSAPPPGFTESLPSWSVSAGVIYRLPHSHRNRVYLKHLDSWINLLPHDQREAVLKTSYLQNTALVSVFYLGHHAAVEITSARVVGATLHLALYLQPPGPNDSTIKGVYDVAAVSDPWGPLDCCVNRVVVDSERVAPAPASDTAFYSSELGVPVQIDPGLRPVLTPDIVFDEVTQQLLSPPAAPGNRIASIEASPTMGPDFSISIGLAPPQVFWLVRLIGRYHLGALPPCVPPPPPGGPPSNCGPLEMINPTAVVIDGDGVEFGMFGGS
jgi:hypothetical protein